MISSIIILCTSCSPFNKELVNTTNIKKRDVIKIIKAFDHNKNNFFESMYPKRKNYLKFISSENYIIRWREDTIGSNSKYFPKSYFEFRRKLFVVYDSTKIITPEIINKLKEYNVLNSVYYDFTDQEIIEKNIYAPSLKINEKNKSKSFKVRYK